MTKPIQIAHEAPISLMSLVRELTDYDYALVHLLDQDPNYVEYFKQSKAMGRKIIMDCSVYELGHSYDWEKYDYWIRTIQPDEYVVPDIFMKMEENHNEFDKWNTSFGYNIKEDGINTKTIGVVQGNTLEEFEMGYKFMAAHADKIAISFGYGYFWDEYLNNNYVNEFIENGLSATKTKFKPLAYHDGRRKLLKHFIDRGIINYNKPHHLLGCGLPDEFRLYADEDEYSFIESIDTTHPVMTAMNATLYPYGMDRKSDKKMVDLYDQQFHEEVKDTVIKNVNYFREEICGYSKLN
jgi:hypothetical protein